MVDLQTQYRRIQQEIDEGIREVIESAAFVKGPKVRAFAEHLAAWLGVRHVIPVGNEHSIHMENFHHCAHKESIDRRWFASLEYENMHESSNKTREGC